MKNKLALSLLTLALLTACSGNGQKTEGDAAAGNNAGEVTQAISQEQNFIKIQAKQAANTQAMKKFAAEAYKDVSNQEQAQAAQAKIKTKVEELNQELRTFYQGLDLTDTDLKAYIKLNEDALKVQQDLEQEGNRLQQLAEKSKKQPDNKETAKYVALKSKLMRLTLDLLNQKNKLDKKFAASATNLPVKEFYQVSDVLNEKNRQVQIMSADKNIKSQQDYTQRLATLLPKVDADTIKALQALKITDGTVNDYVKQSVKVLQNEIELFKRAPQMQQEMNKDKKLSPASQKFEEESEAISDGAEEKLAAVLQKLAE